jgi:hypothetical protein
MAMTAEYCEARADEAAVAADTASLDNVRERELRSEAAWRVMGERIRATGKAREERELARGEAVGEALIDAEDIDAD